MLHSGMLCLVLLCDPMFDGFGFESHMLQNSVLFKMANNDRN